MSSFEQDAHEVVQSLLSKRNNRRNVLTGMAGSILAASGMVAVGTPVFAQDASPEAEPAGDEGDAAALPMIPPEMEEFANDWPMAQQNYAATRVASGGTIDSSNVADLGVAWELPLDASSAFGAITSNPIVLGDTVYIIDNAANIQSLDRNTGEVKWRVDNNVSTFGPNGVAVGYGYLVGVLGDTAEVLTLDAETGEEIWRFQLANHNALGITMAPLIFDGYVIVSTEPGGNTKGTYQGGANGVVYCLDIQTGITLWTWDTVEDDLWGNFRVNSGGGLWYPPSVDVETGILYMGIGNAAPFIYSPENPNAASRPGPNDYANCLVALDPNLGRVLWYINVKPADLYDHDNQQTPVLATVKIGESDADLVFTSGKHGFVAAVYRESGQEYWRVPVGIHQDSGLLTLPSNPEDALTVFPGLLGGVESPLAYKDGVVYAAALNFSAPFYGEGFIYDPERNYSEATSNLVAIDASNGQIIWDTEIGAGIAGPGPVISGDLLFTGTLDGIVRAFSLVDGSQVWSVQTSAGVNAPFAVAGDMLFVPTGTFISPSAESPETLPGYFPALIAFQIGAEGAPTLAEAGEISTPPAEGDGGANEVFIRAFDLGFDPNTFEIPADTDVTITLVNDGALQHDFAIDGTDYVTDLLNGGETTSLVINLPAGQYDYYCTVTGHREAGMAGTLTVA